jgi:hypothetical protein
MSRTIHGTYTTGIKLTNPADNPVTITTTGAILAGGYAIYGAVGTAWTIANQGRLESGGVGITLASGGEIINGTNAN